MSNLLTQSQKFLLEMESKDCGGLPESVVVKKEFIKTEPEDKKPEIKDEDDFKRIKPSEIDIDFTTIKKFLKPFDSHSRTLKLSSFHRSSKNKFRCPKCPRSINGKSGFMSHMASHLNSRSLTCKECQKEFTKYQNLKQHMLVHSDEVPYPCEICGRGFKRRSAMEDHILTVHEGKKHFRDQDGHACRVCKKVFTGASSLRRHMMIHKREKPFSCSICQKKFRRNTNLKNHLLVHNDEKPFVCHICNLAHRRKDRLKMHLQKKHGILYSGSTEILVKEEEEDKSEIKSEGQDYDDSLLLDEEDLPAVKQEY